MKNIFYNASLFMLYAGIKKVGSWWNYQNIISPFYRLYYVDDGQGRVYINNTHYDLLPGMLFLIPKFTPHSYECKDFMNHYYICFFDDWNNCLGIQNPSKLKLQVWANELDSKLIKRYMDLNSYKHLITCDPRHYDNNYPISNSTNNNIIYTERTIESDGILLQLFSRFITEESLMAQLAGNASYEKLYKIIQYINNNLEKHLSVECLAEQACITSDHFSKIFKKIVGLTPCEYIQMKRIQRAQHLLLSTHYNITQIAEKIGIYNLSQFTHLFTKIAKCTPTEYRYEQLKNESKTI